MLCGVCTVHKETWSPGFLVWPQNQGRRFLPVWLKTGNYGLVVLASKLPRQFFGLDFKIKWATVCQLCHKTDRRMKTVRDRRQDLIACFTWKQDGVRFPNLTSRLVEARRG
jgi:hypothetical protein